ncbi:MAG: LytTR family DNA-binding domain-containing protein [Gammaproteobacteria bacterium]|nr:LytTR family DNA-binding domain-containing protein [Gammaproteobacteria bacterium]
MRILIVDDEAPARRRLAQLVEKIEGAEVVGEAATGRAALKEVERANPDCLLLDIRMPDMDGLECARHLAQLDTPPAIIFTTAYDQFAMKAFEARAADYLLKPIRVERLERALRNAERPNAAQQAQLAGMQQDSGARRHICARVRDSLKLVPVTSIYYFRADQKYVVVRHEDGEVLIEDPLKSLEEEFSEEFIRVHRNALAARKYLDSLEKDKDGHFHLRLRECDETLEVSRRLVPEVRKLIRNG